ncbi:hypothetical protein V2E39_01805 [Chryseobacterium arthrosphaerae]|uniref:Uncharacterized protein n=1 Tax=Chryseobacterium arthrosphaerae TaxID=651561 RepID=A0ABU7QU95_9FLAO|nr:hypothetical protein [Chryseobacterium arthrosphaerae]QUY53642.1 hypothetical protein I2F65_12130 [Chryseobacterium arthrosphaerae]UEQ77974.1 hypothetical protein J8N07_06645 [Chryseobacterium arthrosphaerae]
MELPKHAVPLKDAQRWIQNWQTRTDITGTEIKAHMIPPKDVSDIFTKDPNVINLRGYNAINDDKEFKFLLVGVDILGDDMVDYEKGYYIYDMTTPCPSVCSRVQWLDL